MAIFAKESADRSEPRSGGHAAGEGALSIVANGMRVTGDIDSTGVVKIEGFVEGTIRAARQVLLGRQGEVKGDIHAREVVLGGRVEGTVVASERVELQGTAFVNGDIQTKTIVVLEGGRINGSVRMDDASAATASSNTAATNEPDTAPKPIVSVVR
ncbi:MAG TPA: polymer-forming cytoskeletal protein [Gemmatimonadaceae bacterium]|nr:polymer-forming cytoskeletal protein [Gemmatimonadaceae bacterium]